MFGEQTTMTKYIYYNVDPFLGDLDFFKYHHEGPRLSGSFGFLFLFFL